MIEKFDGEGKVGERGGNVKQGRRRLNGTQPSVDSVESTCLNVDEQQFVHAYVLIRHDNTRMIH